MRIVGIAGTITGSKPENIIAEALKKAEKMDPSVTTEMVNLKALNLPFCDGRETASYPAVVQDMIRTIQEADMLLIASPIFQASIPGALKNMFDLLPTDILLGKPVGCIATSGTYQHFLVVESQLKPILSYLKAYTLPSYVYVHRDDFSGSTIINPDIHQRIDAMLQELLHFPATSPAGAQRS